MGKGKERTDTMEHCQGHGGLQAEFFNMPLLVWPSPSPQHW